MLFRRTHTVNYTTTKVRLTPKPSGSTRLSGQYIDFLLRSQDPYILRATPRHAGDGRTIIIYEISQLHCLCGARSGSPQLRSDCIQIIANSATFSWLFNFMNIQPFTKKIELLTDEPHHFHMIGCAFRTPVRG